MGKVTIFRKSLRVIKVHHWNHPQSIQSISHSQALDFKPSGSYMYCTTCFDYQKLHFVFMFCMVLTVNGDFSLNSINQLIFVMVKCGVLFEVRTEFLNNI
jgi:hypothetical protein